MELLWQARRFHAGPWVDRYQRWLAKRWWRTSLFPWQQRFTVRRESPGIGRRSCNRTKSSISCQFGLLPRREHYAAPSGLRDLRQHHGEHLARRWFQELGPLSDQGLHVQRAAQGRG